MIVAGCDVGSLTAKAVIMADDDILSQAVLRVRAQPADAARQVMQQALDAADCVWEDVVFCVGTGYGKDRVPFADRVESEIACHARGAWWRVPSTRMIIDIGGQDAKAMRVDAEGRVVRYIYNDKCASGTGRFLEIMADALEVRLEDMGREHRGGKRCGHDRRRGQERGGIRRPGSRDRDRVETARRPRSPDCRRPWRGPVCRPACTHITITHASPAGGAGTGEIGTPDPGRFCREDAGHFSDGVVPGTVRFYR